MTAELRDAMLRHPWPGNIRELENVVKRYVILQDQAALLSDLQSSETIRPIPATSQPTPAPLASPPDARAQESEVAKANRTGNGNASHDSEGRPPSLAEVARLAMAQAERDLIIPTLRRVHWNRRRAAPLLGVSYKTLLNKIKEHGIAEE
jgi:DNA-binding NtrC family response regulator